MLSMPKSNTIMANFTDLPTEVLDTIVTQLLHLYLNHSYPRNCLLELSFVCRRLNDIVNTILYQSVYYESNSGIPAGPAEVSLSYPYIPPTRIFHLGYFSQTLEDSPALRALVSDVDITWTKKGYTKFTEQRISHIAQILAGCARSLHLAPPEPSSVFTSFSSLTSLSLTYASTPYLFNAYTLDSLYDLCTIPTLKRLALSHWRLWDIGTTADESEPRSSNITHLALYRSGFPGPSLAQVLTWPRSLESFIIQSYPYENLYSEEQTRYSPRELFDYMQPQRESLKSLMAVINSIKWEANSSHLGDGSTLRDFSSLTQLKRLCISRELLGFPASRRGSRSPFEINIALPPLIEQLHVDLQFSGSWDQLELMDEKLNEPLAQGVFGVLDCLQRVVTQKAEQAPNLRRMVFYYGTFSKERKLLVQDRDIPFASSARVRALRDEAAKAGVQLVAWTNWRRPLWGDWMARDGLR